MIARCYLYVPANNAAMLGKASSRGADALIVDFEDSVAKAEKDQARANFDAWIENFDSSVLVWVRINADSIDDDLKFINSEKITGVVVPKATVENLTKVSKIVGEHIQLSALIESSDSILKAAELASVNKVSFLQIGQLDLRAELGLAMDGISNTLNYALSHLVLASAAAGIQQPIAPMHRDFNDEVGLRETSLSFKNDGFFGRSCVHPKQIEIINDVFSTSPQELAEAANILDALDKGIGVATDSQGRMIDEASARLARRIIERNNK